MHDYPVLLRAVKITVAHDSTKEEVKQAVNRSLDDIFTNATPLPVKMVQERRAWTADTLTFSFIAKMGPMGLMSTPISGTVLVTTPQDVALSDVSKALAMLQRLNVPVIGVVENMSAFACPDCGSVHEIFGRGGGERFAQEHGLAFLGKVPLDVTVRQGGDVGVPAVAQREPGPAAHALTAIAQVVAARMSVRAAQASTQPVLTVS